MSEKKHSLEKRADRLLITLFALILAVTATWQIYHLAQGRVTDKERFEEKVELDSLASIQAKETVQATKRLFNWRTEGVVVKDGVSYLVEDLQHLSRRGEYVYKEGSAYSAIVDFRDQLASRTIKLVVMIVDGKGLGENAGTKHLVAALKAKNIDVLHVSGEPVDQYLRDDSHWRPEMMERQAHKLSQMITGIPQSGEFSESMQEVTNMGDLTRLNQTVTIRSVEMKHAAETAKVLILGDSYSNIFSAPEMGWGKAAGLGERLSFYLKSECKVVAVNGNGAHASRRKLMRNPIWLEEKRVVVWQFAARELDQERWEKIEISDGRPNQADLSKEGYADYEVLDIPAWKKNSPYPTSVTELLLKRKSDGAEVLVKMLLKENRKFTRVDTLKRGQVIRLKISDPEKQPKYQRVELFTLDRFDLEVYWGEF